MIHLRISTGVVACGLHRSRRWQSMEITSVSGIQRVTCRGCLRTESARSMQHGTRTTREAMMGGMEDPIVFLNARYDGQAADHWQVRDHCMQCGEDWPCYPTRDIEAKREIVGHCEYFLGWTAEHDSGVTDHEIDTMRFAGREILLRLALPYADHRDYREDWRP